MDGQEKRMMVGWIKNEWMDKKMRSMVGWINNRWMVGWMDIKKQMVEQI